MKYLEYFENVEKGLKVGDYVKIDLAAYYDFNYQNDLGDFKLKTDIGEIIRINLKDPYPYTVLLDGFDGVFRKEEILKKLTPEEFEMEKSVKKYNL